MINRKKELSPKSIAEAIIKYEYVVTPVTTELGLKKGELNTYIGDYSNNDKIKCVADLKRKKYSLEGLTNFFSTLENNKNQKTNQKTNENIDDIILDSDIDKDLNLNLEIDEDALLIQAKPVSQGQTKPQPSVPQDQTVLPSIQNNNSSFGGYSEGYRDYDDYLNQMKSNYQQNQYAPPLPQVSTSSLSTSSYSMFPRQGRQGEISNSNQTNQIIMRSPRNYSNPRIIEEFLYKPQQQQTITNHPDIENNHRNESIKSTDTRIQQSTNNYIVNNNYQDQLFNEPTTEVLKKNFQELQKKYDQIPIEQLISGIEKLKKEGKGRSVYDPDSKIQDQKAREDVFKTGTRMRRQDIDLERPFIVDPTLLANLIIANTAYEIEVFFNFPEGSLGSSDVNKQSYKLNRFALEAMAVIEGFDALVMHIKECQREHHATKKRKLDEMVGQSQTVDQGQTNNTEENSNKRRR